MKILRIIGFLACLALVIIAVTIKQSTTITQQTITGETIVQVQNVYISLTVGDDIAGVFEVAEGSTAYDVMDKAKGEGKIEYTGKMYEGMGYFVETVAGVEGNTKDNLYWTFYINGKKAEVGVSGYLVQDGDQLAWKYEKNEF